MTDQLATVTSRFVRWRGIPSRLIQWQTWGHWSHVEHVMPEGTYIGARFRGGVQPRDPGYDRKRLAEEAFYDVQVTPDQRDRIHAFLRSQVGKGYDLLGDLGFVSRADWVMPDRWFCSRLEFTAFTHVGIWLLREDRSYRVSPRILALSPLYTPR